MSIGCGVKDKGKSNKSSKDGLKKPRRKLKVAMWSTARKRIMCLPQPDAVCGIGGRIACIPQPSEICRSDRAHVVTTSTSQVNVCKSKEHGQFFSWLKTRGENSGSSAISIGTSSHGRALYASRTIHAGECILQVSRDLMITPDKLPEELARLLASDVTEWASLALFLLAEQYAGQASSWSPYIGCLPPHGTIHSTIFWKKEELAFLKRSPVHRETIQRRAVIRTEYGAVENALGACSHMFGGRVSLREFKHAYATVCSRAWGIEALKTLALVPFVDFCNHNAHCRTLLAYDEDKQCAEVIADRDYLAGEQVVISYGQLSNATLALDFGFALPYNPFDQAEIWMGISRRDELRDTKLELLHAHDMQTMPNGDGSDSGGDAFLLQEVKSLTGRGKGIPQSLRAFARVVCSTTLEELEELAAEAAASDGRLARRPLKDKVKEAQAMNLVLAYVDNSVQQHVAAVLALQAAKDLPCPRREIAEAVLGGELRVLRSASNWLKQHSTPSTVLSD